MVNSFFFFSKWKHTDMLWYPKVQGLVRKGYPNPMPNFVQCEAFILGQKIHWCFICSVDLLILRV